MARKVKKLTELHRDLMKTKDAFKRASILALISTANRAELIAKKNAKEQFTGRWGRTLSGRLLNSIFHEYGGSSKKPVAYVGTRGIAYGRIHEEGGTIVPQNAKFLWQRLPDINKKGSKFRRLTPFEFYALAKSQSDFFYHKTDDGKLFAAYAGPRKIQLLFYLRKKVKIPARPYLNPAVKEAIKYWPKEVQRFYDMEVDRI